MWAILPSAKRGDATGVIRLPMSFADFRRRRFRINQPEKRALLEQHARYFLAGFNLAVRHWRAPHAALSEIPAAERGFAYEGAGMHAALRDAASFRRARAFERLLEGPGAAYVHLSHVGYGWGLRPTGLPVSTPVPATPLLRWLALDGAGFAETYFWGIRRLYRRCHRVAAAKNRALLAGSGRALWFVECANPAGIAGVIAGAPAWTRAELWSGVGLAACYAGGVDEPELAELVRYAGFARPHFAQGALFAIAARHRANVVPSYTEWACRELFDVSVPEAASWTEHAAAGLTDATDISAYLQWKARLRQITVRNPSS